MGKNNTTPVDAPATTVTLETLHESIENLREEIVAMRAYGAEKSKEAMREFVSLITAIKNSESKPSEKPQQSETTDFGMC